MSLHSTPRVLISNNTAVTAGTNLSNLALGELAFLKPNGAFLASGNTLADAATIQPVLGRGAGKAPKFGPVIQGRNIKRYEGKSGAAAVQQVTFIGSNTVTGAISPLLAGTVSAPAIYSLHINFTFDKELYSERQNRRSYSVSYTTTPTQLKVATDFAALINADVEANKFVVAAVTTQAGNNGISLTGKVQAYNPLVGYELVRFTTSLDLGFDNSTRIDENGYVHLNGAAHTVTGATSTPASPGAGTYELVADLEEFSIGYDGALNRTKFPVPAAEKFAASGTAPYDLYVIEFEDVHASASLNGTVSSPETVIIAVNDGTLNQGAIQTLLNAYMASTPANFAALSL